MIYRLNLLLTLFQKPETATVFGYFAIENITISLFGMQILR